jgi:hypothetical protein
MRLTGYALFSASAFWLSLGTRASAALCDPSATFPNTWGQWTEWGACSATGCDTQGFRTRNGVRWTLFQNTHVDNLLLYGQQTHLCQAPSLNSRYRSRTMLRRQVRYTCILHSPMPAQGPPLVQGLLPAAAAVQVPSMRYALHHASRRPRYRISCEERPAPFFKDRYPVAIFARCHAYELAACSCIANKRD